MCEKSTKNDKSSTLGAAKSKVSGILGWAGGMSGGAGGSFRGVRNTSKTCEVRNWAKSFGNLDLDSLRRIGLRI